MRNTTKPLPRRRQLIRGMVLAALTTAAKVASAGDWPVAGPAPGETSARVNERVVCLVERRAAAPTTTQPPEGRSCPGDACVFFDSKHRPTVNPGSVCVVDVVVSPAPLGMGRTFGGYRFPEARIAPVEVSPGGTIINRIRRKCGHNRIAVTADGCSNALIDPRTFLER